MGKKYDNIPQILPKLNGRKVLVLGNHDLGFSDPRPGKEADGELQYLNNGILKVYRGLVPLEQILLDNNEPVPFDLSFVDVCHFPFKGTTDHSDIYEARYDSCLVEDTGRWLFHGHTHQTTPMTRKNMINVGVDAWDMFPIDLNTLVNTVGNFTNLSKNNL